MKKTDYFGFFLVLAIGIIGCMMGNFMGGILVGFSTTLLLLMTLGKWLADKTINRVNKNILDNVLNRKNY